MDALQIANLQDYQHLGIDIDVTPDLSENEQLRAEFDCIAQDLVNMWTQPPGLADGTAEGADYGFDLRAQLSRGFTRDALFAMKIAMQNQALRDDRVDDCTVILTAFEDGSLLVRATVNVGQAAYPFSFRCTPNTVGDLYVESLGT